MSAVIAKRYRIDSTFKHGGTVFQAFDLQLARTVALKMLPGERLRERSVVERFFQEATAAARLGHANVVRVYDVTEHGGRSHLRKGTGRDPVMVMEYVPGHALDYFIESRELLPSEEARDPFERKIRLLIQICRGLHYGHELGLVHGSLTPSNIRVTVSGEPKILNFGITPVTGGSPSLFTSPEQCAGTTGIDPRSDIFSLGMVLYELFAVDPPVQERPDASRLEGLATDCPPAVLDIVQRAVAIDRADRFADCQAMEKALRELISGVPPRETRVGIPVSLPNVQHGTEDTARAQADALLKEAQDAEASGQPAVASLLALQALQVDPALGDAAEIFEHTQDILRGRREGTPERVQEPLIEAPGPSSIVNRPQPPGPWFMPPPQRAEEPRSRLRSGGSRFVWLVLPVIAVALLLLGAWFATRRGEAGPAPVAAREVTPAPKQPASLSGTVSLDIVPWSRVESIVRVNDGRAMELGELETPCVISLPAGRYMVVVSHPDYGSRQFPIDVRSGEVHAVEHSLLSKQELERELSAPR